MGIKIVCPKCGRPVSAKPANAWKFGRFDVKRYQCESCKSMFNFYQGAKGMFTIPKGK